MLHLIRDVMTLIPTLHLTSNMPPTPCRFKIRLLAKGDYMVAALVLIQRNLCLFTPRTGSREYLGYCGSYAVTGCVHSRWRPVRKNLGEAASPAKMFSRGTRRTFHEGRLLMIYSTKDISAWLPMLRRRYAGWVTSLMLIAVLCTSLMPTPVDAAAGDLDQSFGSGGKVITAFADYDGATDIAIQSDGKIVAAGYSYTGDSFFPEFVLARYGTDGTLDNSFGNGGKVIILTDNEWDSAALAIQPDGKIVVAGNSLLLRYHSNGTLDYSFGNNGIVALARGFEVDQGAAPISIQSGDKILVAGRDNVLARFNNDGTIDSSFGTNGSVNPYFDYPGNARAMTIRPDGKIVVAGYIHHYGVDYDFALARYHSDGTLDDSFGVNGKVTTNVYGAEEAYGVAVQPDGKIVVAGGYSLTLARYNDNGTLDTSFGNNGIATLGSFSLRGRGAMNEIAVQADSKIVVAGGANGNFALARFNSNGTIDSTFGNGGIVITEFSGNYGVPNALAIQPDNKIVAAGSAGDDFVLARYLADPTANPRDVLISEFRLRGDAGTRDEFIELYNNTDAPLTVNTDDGSAGWALVASDGLAKFIIPNGTVIPARGHYLGVNSSGYSLTPAGDITYTTDIPDNVGIALFRTSNANNFTLANRLDAVGSTSETNPLYKEGPGYTPLPVSDPSAITYHEISFVRQIKTSGGPGAGLPIDTDNNAADFLLVDLYAPDPYGGTGQLLGEPGPENLSSPIQRNAQIRASLLDPLQTAAGFRNRFRDATPNQPVCTSQDVHGCPAGTLSIRRTYTNITGAPVSRLRFRIVDITTYPAPAGTAELRALTSGDITVTRTDGSAVQVRGTRLEGIPWYYGGGLNSALTVDGITMNTPLAPGERVNVQFLLGIHQTGNFRFLVNVEALTSNTASAVQAGHPRAARVKKR